jgi:hypothetical protein
MVRLTASLADRYRIEREGQGGMATVYLARDLGFWQSFRPPRHHLR